MRDSYTAYIELCENTKDQYKKNLTRGKPNFDNGFIMPVQPLPTIGRLGTMDLAILMDFQMRHRPHAELESNGWFKCSIEDMLRAEGPQIASPDKQSRMLNKLEDAGFIKRKVMGKPPIRHIWIDFDKYFQERFKMDEK